jgi:hypothetical protein
MATAAAIAWAITPCFHGDESRVACPDHSALSVTAGSTAAARRAGHQVARIAVTATSAATPA